LRNTFRTFSFVSLFFFLQGPKVSWDRGEAIHFFFPQNLRLTGGGHSGHDCDSLFFLLYFFQDSDQSSTRFTLSLFLFTFEIGTGGRGPVASRAIPTLFSFFFPYQHQFSGAVIAPGVGGVFPFFSASRAEQDSRFDVSLQSHPVFVPPLFFDSNAPRAIMAWFLPCFFEEIAHVALSPHPPDRGLISSFWLERRRER